MDKAKDDLPRLSPEQALRLAALNSRQRQDAHEIERITQEVMLRQWCIDRAIRFAERAVEFSETVPAGTPCSAIARDIFDFVWQPFNTTARP